MHTKSLSELSRLLADRSISSRELVDHYIQRIEQHNPQLNAFITVLADKARQQADSADKLRAEGKATALTGLPIDHKDLFCTLGERTTCVSLILENFFSP